MLKRSYTKAKAASQMGSQEQVRIFHAGFLLNSQKHKTVNSSYLQFSVTSYISPNLKKDKNRKQGRATAQNTLIIKLPIPTANAICAYILAGKHYRGLDMHIFYEKNMLPHRLPTTIIIVIITLLLITAIITLLIV